MSADVEKEPPPGNNYRHLVVENSYQQIHEKMNLSEIAIAKKSIFTDMNLFYEWMDYSSQIIVESKAIRELAALAKKETFYLVIYEIIGQDFLLGNSH